MWVKSLFVPRLQPFHFQSVQLFIKWYMCAINKPKAISILILVIFKETLKCDFYSHGLPSSLGRTYMVPKRKVLDTVLSLLNIYTYIYIYIFFFFNENKGVVGGGSAY